MKKVLVKNYLKVYSIKEQEIYTILDFRLCSNNNSNLTINPTDLPRKHTSSSFTANTHLIKQWEVSSVEVSRDVVITKYT